ncbi:hypothetical protein GCM10022415_33510 [Knoellia locipacati]|uniref:Uncharacterized protein n=1 Tax=Knoellia locipacati TaxID=882824 RepID=A0A512T4T5_9MICO|nr:hypothetical protein [Knoellia locipacati]GEQ15236.1 hypothetical protein KLO01_32830 [Knoellia locipacati]
MSEARWQEPNEAESLFRIVGWGLKRLPGQKKRRLLAVQEAADFRKSLSSFAPTPDAEDQTAGEPVASHSDEPPARTLISDEPPAHTLISDEPRARSLRPGDQILQALKEHLEATRALHVDWAEQRGLDLVALAPSVSPASLLAYQYRAPRRSEPDAPLVAPVDAWYMPIPYNANTMFLFGAGDEHSYAVAGSGTGNRSEVNAEIRMLRDFEYHYREWLTRWVDETETSLRTFGVKSLPPHLVRIRELLATWPFETAPDDSSKKRRR